jgi:flagellar P-ring protein precursor FlgI
MPFSENGETVVVPQTELYAEEGANSVITLKEGATVSEIVESLNDLGVSARDMIAILQAIRSAGALHAEIVAL